MTGPSQEVNILRKFWWLIALLVILVCGLLWLIEPVRGLVAGWFSGGEEPTEEATETITQEATLPPTDEPTRTVEPTDEPTTEVATEVATETQVVTTEPPAGDGVCNSPCSTDKDCLAGLACLPAASGAKVCWNSVICLQTEAPTAPPTENPGGPQCGNGVCDPGEHVYNCSVDCGQPPEVCGNGVCEGGEPTTCPADCPPVPPPCVCGNGICQPACGEDSDSCSSDCG